MGRLLDGLLPWDSKHLYFFKYQILLYYMYLNVIYIIKTKKNYKVSSESSCTRGSFNGLQFP